MTASTHTSLGLAGFLVGIYLASGPLVQLNIYYWLVFAGLILVWIYIRKRLPARPGPLSWALYPSLFVILSFMLGYAFTTYWRSSRSQPYQEGSYTFEGIISEPPDRRSDKTLLTVRPTRWLQGDISPPDHDGLILISTTRFPIYQYGDVISVQGKIVKPEPIEDFDYPLYLEKSGIYGLIYRPKNITKITSNQGSWLITTLYALRQKTEGAINAAIPEPEASFLGGVLLGSKRNIPSDIQDELRATGTSHIIAISGANITILLGIIRQLLPLYKRWSQFWATLAISLFITLLTGASASVIRGALVATLSAYLAALGRKAWATPFILFSATLILMGNPLLLKADPGFQLSFAAFAGLAYLSGPISSFIEKNRISGSWPAAIQGALSETTAATLGTAPISLLVFGQVSLMGLLVNPLILWLLPAATFLGLLLCFLGYLDLAVIHQYLPIISLPLWLILRAILSVIHNFSLLGWGIIRV